MSDAIQLWYSVYDHDKKFPYEAAQLTADNRDEVAKWCGGQTTVEHDAIDSKKTYAAINVPTFHGMWRANEGDFIYKGESGKFYVRKPGQFHRVFTPA